MILIDDDVGPDSAVSVTQHAAIGKGCRLVDVVFVIDGEGVLVSFHVVANPKAKTDPNRNFVTRRRNASEFLVYDYDGKGMFCRACRDTKMDLSRGLKLCTSRVG